MATWEQRQAPRIGALMSQKVETLSDGERDFLIRIMDDKIREAGPAMKQFWLRSRAAVVNRGW